jgi:hypothetical protein
MTEERIREHKMEIAVRNNTRRRRRRNIALRSILVIATPAASNFHGSFNVRPVRSSGV